jgi:hypothetical protein
MTVAVGRSGSDPFRQWRLVVIGLFRFTLALVSEQFVLEVANAFDHRCCLVAKVSVTCILAASPCSGIAVASCRRLSATSFAPEIIIISDFFYLNASCKATPTDRFDGDGGDL